MQKKISWLFIIALIAFGVFYFYQKYKMAPTVDITKLSLVNLAGEAFDVNSLKGKKVMVCFSASWCGNCISEMNALKKIKDTELQDIEIVIIDDEPLDRVIKFKEYKDYPFTFLKLNQTFPSIGILSIPVSYFYDANLVLKADEVGEIEWSDPSTREHYKQLMN